MIPIRNKKKTLKMTVEEMRNYALAYVEKYAPSKQQLKKAMNNWNAFLCERSMTTIGRAERADPVV